MKKKIKFIGGTILLILIGITTFLLAEGGNGEVEKTKGGNGEVIHKTCMSNLDEAGKCIKKIYPKVEVVVTITQEALQVINGRGDGAVVDENITLVNKERFILNVNIEEAKKPVTCNIKGLQIVQDDKRATLDIAVKDIDDKVIVYNKDGEVIIEYTVIK